MLRIIVGTSLHLLFQQLQKNPGSSFGFLATPSMFGDILENNPNNQRYRIYKHVMQNFFGKQTFTHFADPHCSAYLMINNAHPRVHDIRRLMQWRFIQMYPDLFFLQLAEL